MAFLNKPKKCVWEFGVEGSPGGMAIYSVWGGWTDSLKQFRKQQSGYQAMPRMHSYLRSLKPQIQRDLYSFSVQFSIILAKHKHKSLWQTAAKTHLACGHGESSFSHEGAQNPAICNNKGGPRGFCAKWKRSENHTGFIPVWCMEKQNRWVKKLNDSWPILRGKLPGKRKEVVHEVWGWAVPCRMERPAFRWWI